ncbi:ABC-three component system protein [Rhodococcus qingshengii]|uniref:ABC-three component system protein n=1 Tax=Rhodococcus qingshengii TaxID=334542 RepID=UPI0021BBAB42|nr:ABC-three component system protein [Rhodococcus qingshengii]UXF67503.1 hypothetical protein N6G92_00220 [Rhodococcus qingshengii]
MNKRYRIDQAPRSRVVIVGTSDSAVLRNEGASLTRREVARERKRSTVERALVGVEDASEESPVGEIMQPEDHGTASDSPNSHDADGPSHASVAQTEKDESHSAAASVLGYLHQTQWGLLELLRRKKRFPDATLTLEMHDDVAWDIGGTPVELKQLKLHTTGLSSLGDSSPDIWRTIGVWLDNGRPTDPYGPILTLVTNSVAIDGSIAALLRATPDTRKVADALELLESIAVKSSNKVTAKARAKFLALDPSERATFVERMYVADASEDLAGVEEEVRDLLSPGAPREHFDIYFDQVVGWWSRISRNMLVENSAISVGQLLSALERIRDQFSSENLPSLVEADEIDVQLLNDQHADRTYIKQLHLIGTKPRPIEKAILDYQRAYLQETRWLDRDLVDYIELERFAAQLVDEWERAYDFMCGELSDGVTDDELRKAGRQLLQALSDSSLNIRARFTDPFFSRGRRHALADDSRIGWHPNFEEHLKSLLLESAGTSG